MTRTDALTETGSLAGWEGPDETLERLRQEVDAGRPVIAGSREFGQFPAAYLGGATSTAPHSPSPEGARQCAATS